MKKLFSLLAILMMAMTAWADAIIAVQPTEGNGQSGTPYKIASAANLVWFAQQVNGGQTSINAKLTADIDLGTDQTMIGTDTHKYAGTFDGDGHTVTINYTATAQYTALFSVVGDATIKNLKTAGSISTGNQYAAGIVAIVRRTANISDCASSVAITSTFTESEKDATHGGIVAYCGTNDSGATATTNLTNVLFNGNLLGEYAKNCGGLIGWSKHSATITNCLFNPSEVTVSTTNAKTLARGNSVTITNSFYSKTLGEAQGTSVTADALSKGEVCYKLNGQTSTGTLHWYQNINNGQTVDDAPVLDNTHGTVYFGVNTCPASTGYSNKTHTGGSSYDADGIMPCTNTGCPGSYQPASLVSDKYEITNKGNLCWFAQQVNGGQTSINAKLTADINMGDNQTMIGTSDNKYRGTFDGDGHTVTVNYVATENYTALFRSVQDATIQNLKTAGSITTGYQFAGGIVAESYDDYSEPKISRCASSMTITSTFATAQDGTHGGIVAESHGLIYLYDVLFNGKLLGANATHCGGLIGYTYKGQIYGCWFNPSEVTFSSNGAQTLARVARGYGVSFDYSCYSTTLGGTDNQGRATTPATIASGEVCYILNREKNTGSWTQNLETDDQPTFGTAGVHYARTMANEWGTVVLPYDVTYSQSNGKYKLYKLSAASASTLTFTEYADGTIAAGTPMAVKKLTGDGIDIAPASTPNYSTTINPVSEVSGWTMNGTYTNLTNQTGIYFIANNQFWWAESPITIAPFRAWFTGPNPTSGAKGFEIVVEDETDGIDLTPALSQGEGVGKYLENGKVVIVRNGKKYNTLGAPLCR